MGDALDVDWGVVSPETFRYALGVELEHQDVTHGDLTTTGRIALAHLREAPDYYARLAPMEAAMEEYWSHRPKPSPTRGGALATLASMTLIAASFAVLAALVVYAVVLAGRRGRDAFAPCSRYWEDHPPLVDALGYATPAAGWPLRRGRRPACGVPPRGAPPRGFCGLGGRPPAHAHDPYLARDPGAADAFETNFCRFAPAFCSGGALEP